MRERERDEAPKNLEKVMRDGGIYFTF